jgi:hypothetical protein
MSLTASIARLTRGRDCVLLTKKRFLLSFDLLERALLQKLQHLLRLRVRLREHRDTGLLKRL